MAANEKRRSSPAAAAAPAAAGTDQGRSALSANGVAEGEAEFLLQSGVTDMVREALLKVLEARPEKPVDFLAGYFEKLMQSSPETATEALSDGGDPQRQLSLDRALWYLSLAHHSHRWARRVPHARGRTTIPTMQRGVPRVVLRDSARGAHWEM